MCVMGDRCLDPMAACIGGRCACRDGHVDGGQGYCCKYANNGDLDAISINLDPLKKGGKICP